MIILVHNVSRPFGTELSYWHTLVLEQMHEFPHPPEMFPCRQSKPGDREARRSGSLGAREA